MFARKHDDVLGQIQIASPCKADWDSMTGDEKARFCGQCSKNVYNLSEMSKGEAEKLILEKEGKLCVRFYRRADGTVLTEDCPVGLRTLRNGYRKLSAIAAALFSFVLGISSAKADDKTGTPPMMGAPLPPERLMGEMVAIPRETPSKPWMDAYKKAALTTIMKRIDKNTKLDAPEFLVTVSKAGKVISVYPTKCSADQTGVLTKTFNETTLPAFPKEATEDLAVLKFTLKR